MTKEKHLEEGEVEVGSGSTNDGAEETEWPRFGKPMIDPAEGVPAVREKHLSWPWDLDKRVV